jgi:hypothetical protein
MESTDPDRILDFAPIGMWWELTRSTADTGGEAFEAVNADFHGWKPPHISGAVASTSSSRRPEW